MEKKRTEYHTEDPTEDPTEDHNPKKKTKTHSRDRLHLKLQSVAEKAKTMYPTVQNLPEDITPDELAKVFNLLDMTSDELATVYNLPDMTSDELTSEDLLEAWEHLQHEGWISNNERKSLQASATRLAYELEIQKCFEEGRCISCDNEGSVTLLD